MKVHIKKDQILFFLKKDVIYGKWHLSEETGVFEMPDNLFSKEIITHSSLNKKEFSYKGINFMDISEEYPLTELDFEKISILPFSSDFSEILNIPGKVKVQVESNKVSFLNKIGKKIYFSQHKKKKTEDNYMFIVEPFVKKILSVFFNNAKSVYFKLLDEKSVLISSEGNFLIIPTVRKTINLKGFESLPSVAYEKVNFFEKESNFLKKINLAKKAGINKVYFKKRGASFISDTAYLEFVQINYYLTNLELPEFCIDIKNLDFKPNFSGNMEFEITPDGKIFKQGIKYVQTEVENEK